MLLLLIRVRIWIGLLVQVVLLFFTGMALLAIMPAARDDEDRMSKDSRAVAGPLVAGLVSAHRGAAFVGGLSALGGTLSGLGLPKNPVNPTTLTEHIAVPA